MAHQQDKYMAKLFPQIVEFLGERAQELGQIPNERRQELTQLADFIRGQLEESGTAAVTCICTHNSRRSHLSQVWAKVAAEACGLNGLQTYSGGTEATAMNSRVVESLRRTGFQIEAENPNSDNPVYHVHYAVDSQPIVCFSKVYDRPPNPTANFCAVMNCSSADQACPIVPGCSLRLPIRYEDPKVSDNTPQESSIYDERSQQICREMLYAMRQV